MLNREIGLAGIYSENAAHIPAAGEAWVEHQRTIDQPDHGADILAEPSQDPGDVGQDAWLVLCRLERLSGKFYGLAAGFLRLVGPAVNDEPQVANRCPGRCRPVMPIDRDRLLEQPQSLNNPLFRYRKEDCKPAQVEIVGGEVRRRPRG